jgi:hypothetical protein
MNKKRIFFIMLFVIVSILIGYMIYRFFFSARPIGPITGTVTPTEVTPGGLLPSSGTDTSGRAGTTPTTIVLPPSGISSSGGGEPFQRASEESRFSRVIEDDVSQISISPSGGVRYYNRDDNKFYRLDDTGNTTPLSNTEFFDVDRATFSPTKEEGIIEYPDGSNIYYDFASDRQVTLPRHWENFSFAGDGGKIVAKSVGLDPNNRWLIASNPDGSNIRYLESMGENGHKVQVDWSPNDRVVAFSRTGEALGGDRQQVLLVGQNKENFQALTIEGRDFRPKWSPSGRKLVYSVYSARNNYKPELWITGMESGQIDAGRRPLSIDTWGDKCAFINDDSVVCGVPTSLEVGSGFNDILAERTPDQLVRIDLQTGARTILPLDSEHTIRTITVAEDGKKMFFTDKNKSGLFEVKL